MAINAKFKQPSPYLLICISLLGCGDGSEKGIQTGQLLDSPVSGITYSAETQTGATDANGYFQYQAGETITFSLGDTILGSVPAKELITLFDLTKANVLVDSTTLRTAVGDEQSPLQAVINISVLLQTLDSDGLPSNGINIAPEISTLFSDIQINFQQAWSDFINSPEFKTILARANNQNLLSNPLKMPQESWLALQHLYANLGIDSLEGFSTDLTHVTERKINNHTGVIFYTKSYVQDSNGNEIHNKWDRGYGFNASITISSYDANGNLTRKETDNNGDGIAEEHETWAYESNGNLIRYEVFGSYIPMQTVANNVDRIQTWTYDDNNLIKEEIDYDLDGSIDWSRTTTYDDNGNRIKEEIDHDGDGINDHISLKEYFTEEGLTRIERYSYMSIFPQNISIYEDSNLIQETSYNDDGTVIFTDTMTYDDSGHLILKEYNRDGDGSLELVESWSYDDNANLIQKTIDSDYFNGIGNIDEINSWIYDSNNNLTQTIKQSGDGTVYWSETSAYAGNNLTLKNTDDDGDGLPDKIERYAYDDNGNVIRYEEDRNGDATPDNIITRKYDENGNQIQQNWDQDADGVSDKSFVTTYNTGDWWALFNL